MPREDGVSITGSRCDSVCPSKTLMRPGLPGDTGELLAHAFRANSSIIVHIMEFCWFFSAGIVTSPVLADADVRARLGSDRSRTWMNPPVGCLTQVRWVRLLVMVVDGGKPPIRRPPWLGTLEGEPAWSSGPRRGGIAPPALYPDESLTG